MKTLAFWLVLGLVWGLGIPDRARASEVDAAAITRNILGFGFDGPHFPFASGILDPRFAPVDEGGVNEEIVGWTRAGDSAIWTGHFLAAESFRYAVTRSEDAHQSVWAVFRAIEDMVDVTRQDLLARAVVPVDDPRAQAITDEEAGNGTFRGTVRGRDVYWIGRTSRDQYAGVFFGLSTAYTWVGVDDVILRTSIRSLVVRMIDKLIHSGWRVDISNEDALRVPNPSFVTFQTNLYQIEAILAVGNQVAPGRYKPVHFPANYWMEMVFEGANPWQSYYKFNLAYVHFYNLLRLEKNWIWRTQYKTAYDVLRRTTQAHGNAHFNMIDRVINGWNSKRDAETRQLLDLWLERPRRDFTVDLMADPSIRKCVRPFRDSNGQRLVTACDPIPVNRQVNTEFLWQRSPFQLQGWGSGQVEAPGIDYLLPYWMARCYGVIIAENIATWGVQTCLYKEWGIEPPKVKPPLFPLIPPGGDPEPVEPEPRRPPVPREQVELALLPGSAQEGIRASLGGLPAVQARLNLELGRLARSGVRFDEGYLAVADELPGLGRFHSPEAIPWGSTRFYEVLGRNLSSYLRQMAEEWVIRGDERTPPRKRGCDGEPRLSR
jgi:hypothetical protein